MQSKATGGSGEALRDAAKPSASPESHVASGERSSKGETSPNPSAPANEAVRESPLARSNEASGHALDRQGAHEPSLSFATTATTGRAEATSSGSGAATTMAATTERFHQDNFNQLVERAVFTLRGEQSEARIALKPDQLGHVQMRVVTEHHLVSIKIMAESPVARDLIHAHAHHLKSELQQQGLTVEHIEVSVSDGQGDAYRGERQRETFLRQLASQGLSEQKDETPRLSHGTPRHLSGRSRSSGIDYFA
jgi:flagellar hook-length control protein FliK